MGDQDEKQAQQGGSPSPMPPLSDASWASEWQECRATIGRFDSIVVDLRKYGFSLITALLGASAFISFSSASLDPATAAFVLIMALITILFFIDVYYTSLMNGAAERALDLEAVLPAHKITKYLSDNAHRVKTITVTLYTYLALQFAALLIGLWFELSFFSWRLWLILGCSLAALIIMAAYWKYADDQTHLRTSKPRLWTVPPNRRNQVGRVYNQSGEEVAQTNL